MTIGSVGRSVLYPARKRTNERPTLADYSKSNPRRTEGRKEGKGGRPLSSWAESERASELGGSDQRLRLQRRRRHVCCVVHSRVTRASSGWPELRHSNLPHSSPSSFECRMYPSAYPSAATSKVQATEWAILKQNPSTFGWDMTQNVISPFVRRWDYILGHISAKCWWILIQYGSFWSLQSPTNIMAVTFEWADIRSQGKSSECADIRVIRWKLYIFVRGDTCDILKMHKEASVETRHLFSEAWQYHIQRR